jgi:hypothetical protein
VLASGETMGLQNRYRALRRRGSDHLGSICSQRHDRLVRLVLCEWPTALGLEKLHLLPNHTLLQALIPIPMLWGVKMTKQAKATVIVILGLGVLYVFVQSKHWLNFCL